MKDTPPEGDRAEDLPKEDPVPSGQSSGHGTSRSARRPDNARIQCDSQPTAQVQKPTAVMLDHASRACLVGTVMKSVRPHENPPSSSASPTAIASSQSVVMSS